MSVSFQLLGPAPRQRRPADRLLELREQAQKVIADIDATLLNARIRRHRIEQRSTPAQQRPAEIEYYPGGRVLGIR